MTHCQLLRVHFHQGYSADEEDKSKRPYAVPHVKSLYVATWEKLISKVIYKGYYEATNAFEEAREVRDQLDFYAMINQDNPVGASLAPDPGGQGQTSISA